MGKLHLLTAAWVALSALTLSRAQAGVLSEMRRLPAPRAAKAAPKTPEKAPVISELLKPEALRRILEKREIITNASLEDVDGAAEEGTRKYSYYASMLVHASLARTREALTDYRAYAKMVPYIDKAEYVRAPDLIQVEGGIWKFRLRSNILFEDRGERWIRYKIVAGHFKGLVGDILFESNGEKGTLVYMRGEQTGSEFPPKFVLEKGAEIVFAFTAKRMRSYVEDKDNDHGRPSGQPSGQPSDLPRPRSRL